MTLLTATPSSFDATAAAADTWHTEQLQAVRTSLTALVPPQALWLAEALSHSLGRSGKLLRPQMTLWCARLAGATNWHAVTEAAAVAEMIHIATLLHDDVLDNADLRRGLPTVKQQWGNEVAILSGDYLLAQASRKLAQIGNIRLVAIFSDVLAALCDGEVAQQCNRFDLGLTWEAYIQKCRQKTACLFSAACESAGVVAQLPEPQIQQLVRFGDAFGLAFQLVDDLLDYTATESELGKPVMGDICNGLMTAPVLLGLQQTDHKVAILSTVDHIFQLARQSQPDNPDADLLAEPLATLRSQLAHSNCFRLTQQTIDALLAEGLQELQHTFDPSQLDPLRHLCRLIQQPLQPHIR